MIRNEYLDVLRKNLYNMGEDDKDDVIRYYEEYFDEAGDENRAIEELGNPVVLARKISAESAIKDIERMQNDARPIYEENEDWELDSRTYRREYADNGGEDYEEAPKKRGFFKNVLAILMALCTIPFLPLAIAVFVLGLLVVIVMGAFVLVAAAIGVTFAVAGIISLVVGIFVLFTNFASGLMGIGIGLIVIGLGILIVYGNKGLANLFGKSIVSIGKKKTSRM